MGGVYKTINLTIAPEKKMSLQDVRKAANDYRVFAPTTKWDDTPVMAKDKEYSPFLHQQQINILHQINHTNVTTSEGPG